MDTPLQALSTQQCPARRMRPCVRSFASMRAAHHIWHRVILANFSNLVIFFLVVLPLPSLLVITLIITMDLNNYVLFYSVLPAPLLYSCKPTRLKDKNPPSNQPLVSSNTHTTAQQLSTLQIATSHLQDPPIQTAITISYPPHQPINFKVDVKTWESDLRHLASLNRCAKSHSSDVRQAGLFISLTLTKHTVTIIKL